MGLQQSELSDSTGSKEEVSFPESLVGKVGGHSDDHCSRSLQLSHCPSNTFGLGLPVMEGTPQMLQVFLSIMGRI